MGLLDNIHNSLIFFPSREVIPPEEGINYKDVYLKTEDEETLHGYLLPSKEQTKKILLYLHGNAENVSNWYTSCIEIQNHVPINALVVDYRGYGKSTGKPTIEGAIKDVFAMHDYLLSEGYENKDISVYGMSLGGALAIELASKREVKSLVIQSSFSSLQEVAKDLYPFIPKELVFNGNLNSTKLVKNISVPILISHGDKDEVVFVKHSYKLFAHANQPKKLLILKGAMHNDVTSYFDTEYFQILKEMFL